ncbi:MAG: DUF262 domain-containing protein [Saprospiraceae bacterium]
MKVTVDVGSQEYALQFQQDATSNGTGQRWVGTLYAAANEEVWAWFYEKDGLAKNVEASPNITTKRAALVERIQESLVVYRESLVSELEQEGFSDESEPTPYDPNKIKVRRDFYSIREMFFMMEESSVDLNPEFQRYFVWDNTQKSQFIESLLLGLPLPLFYFSENIDLTFNVVDGLQRLTTIRQYMSNGFAIKGVERLGKEFNGRYFKADENAGILAAKALPAPMVRRIEGTQLVVNVIESSSPPQVKFDIFKRINTGGKHLNNQEIRNCVATPTTRRMLQEMVHNDLFREVTCGSISEIRMDDQELALRFIGFWLARRNRLEYTGNMTAFLNDLVDVLNGMKEKDLQPIARAFQTALLNCQHFFGEYAFRKCLPNHLLPGAHRQAINKSLFTTWTVILSDGDKREGGEQGSLARIQAEQLASKGAFYENITNRTNDRLIIEQVFKSVEAIVQAHLHPQALQPA